MPRTGLLRSRAKLLELFIAANLGFLAVDIVVAHSVNDFAHPTEWIPLAFTLPAAFTVGAFLAAGRDPNDRGSRMAGLVVGWLAIAVGMAGMVWHLESQFFELRTLQSLVYSAPFVAPLAFAGLGLLLLMNRTVDPDTPEWGGWVVFLALAGFVGNFGLSLLDHAQNGFFNPLEWISVGVSALGVAALTVLLLARTPPAFDRVVWAVLGLQAATGVAGFLLHLGPVFDPSSAELFDRIVFGPPLFAPLLFPNLAILAGLGVWHLSATAAQPAQASS